MSSTVSSMWTLLYYFQKHRKLVIDRGSGVPILLEKFPQKYIQITIEKLQNTGFIWVVYSKSGEVALYITPAGKRLAARIGKVHRPIDNLE
ncbi:hypothetical protein HB911_09550 [Listeria booriae]|uniref:hypothetical protein n=1 Tax=Listeria booriae TaxID=1552123 RepID=UPI0016282847|nr:hypothetical protein [Listeria booriae]MBC1558946.1 hypothetical protein [Listeria booriae]